MCRRKIMDIFQALFTLAFEPLFFGFTLFILFSHIQNIINTATSLTICGLWRSLMNDVTSYWWVWIPVGIVLVIWVAGRVLFYLRDKKDAKRLTDILDRIERKL